MSLDEYIELLHWANESKISIITNISSDYNKEKNIIWRVEISYKTGSYFSCTKNGVLSDEEIASRVFTYDDCNVENIKEFIISLTGGEV